MSYSRVFGLGAAATSHERATARRIRVDSMMIVGEEASMHQEKA